MNGKTNVAIGAAANLLVTQPSMLKELFICLGDTIVGFVISDIDVTTSGLSPLLVPYFSVADDLSGQTATTSAASDYTDQAYSIRLKN